MKLGFKGVLASLDSSLEIERWALDFWDTQAKVQSNFAKETKNNVNLWLVQGILWDKVQLDFEPFLQSIWGKRRLISTSWSHIFACGMLLSIKLAQPQKSLIPLKKVYIIMYKLVLDDLKTILDKFRFTQIPLIYKNLSPFFEKRSHCLASNDLLNLYIYIHTYIYI